MSDIDLILMEEAQKLAASVQQLLAEKSDEPSEEELITIRYAS